MKRKTFSLRTELENLQYENELLFKISCSKEEVEKYKELLNQGISLPEGISYDEDDEEDTKIFHKLYKAEDLTTEERKEYIFLKKVGGLKSMISRNQLQQTEILKNIEKMIKFFVVLAIIGIFVSVISFLIILSNL